MCVPFAVLQDAIKKNCNVVIYKLNDLATLFLFSISHKKMQRCMHDK